MANKAEQALRRRCLRVAKRNGWTHIRLHFGAGAAVGWPDDVFMRKWRRIVFVEFKAPGQYASPMQLHRQAMLEDMGFDSILVDDTQEFDAYIT